MTAVAPTSVGQGFDVDLKITGQLLLRNEGEFFQSGESRIWGWHPPQHSNSVHIKVLGDATPGKTSLFVINPDKLSEVEFPFEVFFAQRYIPAHAFGATHTRGTSCRGPNLYAAFRCFPPGKSHGDHSCSRQGEGIFIIAGGAVKYQEDGKTLVNVSLSEIQEVKTAGIGGFNIKLNSGKTIHFAAASLKSSDARTIVEAIQKSMTAPSTN